MKIALSLNRPKNYDNPTTAQQACQDELIKCQRQGTGVILNTLID